MFLVIAAAMIVSGASAALAQVAKGQKIPAPEDVTLETTDGVGIRATWFAGLLKKESVPIIMVHGFGGQRGEYEGFAKQLQASGHSVIVPDLRGHGQSKTQKLPNDKTRTLDADTLRPADMEDMLRDLEACKRFLMDKNNAGECNIEKLCVVGAEFGSILALRWAAADWSVRDLPAYKQGRDVKALVLLSPLQAQKGLSIKEALSVPAVLSQLSIMIVAGKEDSKGTAEAKRLFNSFQAHHPKPPTDQDKQAKEQDLFLVQPNTKVAGTKLLTPALPVLKEIETKIVKGRLADKKSEFLWTERKNPIEN
jgi:alpha-beta hydrolase superfamily lysophospholipase